MELLTEVDVAKILRVKVGTIQQWRSRRRGPDYVLVGDLPRYKPEALEAFTKARTVVCGARADRKPKRRRSAK